MTDKIYIYSITSDQRKIPFQSKKDYFSEKDAHEAALAYADENFKLHTGVQIEVTEIDGEVSWVVLRENLLMDVVHAADREELVSLLKTKAVFTPWELEKILSVLAVLSVTRADSPEDYYKLTGIGSFFKELVAEPKLTKEEEEEMISIGMQITEAGDYSEADVKRHAELAAKAGVSQC